MAAFPPAAVTAATMLNSSDRAPDSTATVPRGNCAGSASASHGGTGSWDSDSGSRSSEWVTTASGAFPDITAICRRSDSSCSARFWLEATAAVIQASYQRFLNYFRIYVRLVRVNTHPPTAVKKRERLLYAVGAAVAPGAFLWRHRDGNTGQKRGRQLSTGGVLRHR